MKNKTNLVPPVHEHREPIVIALKDDSDAEWLRGYNEYCARTGKQLTVSPVWKLRDDNTFSLVMQFGVQKNPATT